MTGFLVIRVFSGLRIATRSRHLLTLHSTSSAERSLQEHLRGRGHLSGLERQDVVERSVFIRGLLPCVSSDELRTFLEEQVGCVSNLQLNQKSPKVNYYSTVVCKPLK